MDRPVRGWAFIGLCACNQAFGLDHAQLIEPVPDARLQCTELGKVPAFTPLLTRVGTKACSQYTESRAANLAMAWCNEPTGLLIEAGPIDGELVPTGIVATSTTTINGPRLSADGERMTVLSTTPADR